MNDKKIRDGKYRERDNKKKWRGTTKEDSPPNPLMIKIYSHPTLVDVLLLAERIYKKWSERVREKEG